MKQNILSRRNFIVMGLFGSSSLLLLPRCTFMPSNISGHFFTWQEVKLVDAIIEQIIPTDEWPGARDAGVTNFIDKQLAGTYKRYQKEYRNGLAAINLSSTALHKKQFEVLAWEEQTGFLKKMEAGKLSILLNEKQGNKIWADGSDKTFFNLIRDHTMQGFYGSPRHGGNRNYVSYRMIGLDFPLIAGQNRYKG